MGSTWHPECFCCEKCDKELADFGFIKNQGRALCHECNAKVGSQIVCTLHTDETLDRHSVIQSGGCNTGIFKVFFIRF